QPFRWPRDLMNATGWRRRRASAKAVPCRYARSGRKTRGTNAIAEDDAAFSAIVFSDDISMCCWRDVEEARHFFPKNAIDINFQRARDACIIPLRRRRQICQWIFLQLECLARLSGVAKPEQFVLNGLSARRADNVAEEPYGNGERRVPTGVLTKLNRAGVVIERRVHSRTGLVFVLELESSGRSGIQRLFERQRHVQRIV